MKKGDLVKFGSRKDYVEVIGTMVYAFNDPPYAHKLGLVLEFDSIGKTCDVLFFNLSDKPKRQIWKLGCDYLIHLNSAE